MQKLAFRNWFLVSNYKWHLEKIFWKVKYKGVQTGTKLPQKLGLPSQRAPPSKGAPPPGNNFFFLRCFLCFVNATYSWCTYILKHFFRNILSIALTFFYILICFRGGWGPPPILVCLRGAPPFESQRAPVSLVQPLIGINIYLAEISQKSTCLIIVHAVHPSQITIFPQDILF